MLNPVERERMEFDDEEDEEQLSVCDAPNCTLPDLVSSHVATAGITRLCVDDSECSERILPSCTASFCC